MQEQLRDERNDPDKLITHVKDLAQQLHNNVSQINRFLYIYTHFNTLKKTALGKHCGKR